MKMVPGKSKTFDQRRHLKLEKSFSETYGLAKRYTAEAIQILVEINRLKWWKQRHTTFEDYCVDELGISKSHFHRLKDREEVIERIPEDCRADITNERQTRVLSDVPTNKLGSIIKDAKSHSKNGHVTAKQLEESKRRSTIVDPSPMGDARVSVKSGSASGSKDKFIVDENGTPIPDDALEWWEDEWGEEHKNDPRVQYILSEISRLKSVVVGGQQKREKRWLKVTNSIANTFDSLRSLISEAKPYAVCTTCMGSPSLQPEGCNFCRSTGLISKWQWDTQSRQEVKDIVLRRAADLKKEREHVH